MLSLKVFKNPTRYNIKLRPPGVRSLARLVRARVKAQPKSQGHQGHGRVGHGIKNLGNPGQQASLARPEQGQSLA